MTDKADRKARDELINQVLVDFAELPDRTSPDDFPDALIVTPDELRSHLEWLLEAAEELARAPKRDGQQSLVPRIAELEQERDRLSTKIAAMESLLSNADDVIALAERTGEERAAERERDEARASRDSWEKEARFRLQQKAELSSQLTEAVNDRDAARRERDALQRQLDAAIKIAEGVGRRAALNAQELKDKYPGLSLDRLREIDNRMCGQRHAAIEITAAIRALIKSLM